MHAGAAGIFSRKLFTQVNGNLLTFWYIIMFAFVYTVGERMFQPMNQHTQIQGNIKEK